MICLSKETAGKLSSRGILAYVAVMLSGNVEATTAALADKVRCQTGVMLEGLKELTVVDQVIVRPSKRGKWYCGEVSEETAVQVLDSSRYRLFLDDLNKFWNFLNPGIPLPFGSTDGIAVRRFLSDHAEWTQAMWQEALQNRARSVKLYGNGSRTQAFNAWIRKLGDYLAGPLNEFNRPVGGTGNGGKAIIIQQGNRAAVQQFLTGSHS